MRQPEWGAVLSLCCLATGCATPSRQDVIAEITPITVRILSTHETVSFTGDVAERWYAHSAELKNEPGRPFVLMGDRDDCPKAADPDQLYLVRVARERRAFGVGGETTEAMLSDQVIVTCEPVPKQP